MSKLGFLLLFWAVCEGILAEVSQLDSDDQPLDFSHYGSEGTSLSSRPLAAAVLRLDRTQYPQAFDTIVSSSIDSIQSRLAPRKDEFSADNFGFDPIASKGFPTQKKKSKKKPRPRLARIQKQSSPLQYEIQTNHDANYNIYKPENVQDGDILLSLKNNPDVAAYFNPTATNIEISHPKKYRTEGPLEDSENYENYKPNAYVTGGSRLRRYTNGKRKQKVRRRAEEDEEEEEDEEDPYNYKTKYRSKPKAFDGDVYSSAYKEEKDPNKEFEYPYDYDDSSYDHKAYERIKALSEKQAEEIKQNPENCKEVIKDGMKCVTCKDPKTGGNYESCSYVAEPKNNEYAYSKEKKFDSKDQPDEPEENDRSSEKRPAKYEESQSEAPHEYDDHPQSNQNQPYKEHRKNDDDDSGSGEKYKSYQIKTSRPKYSAPLRADDEDVSGEKSDDSKQYDYQKALPEFYSDTEPKKDVEHVLAEFKKKDRSACKKVYKNGMTCFQCIDKSGLKHEECMFVSESAPKSSHVAYQELKEFTSKPPTLDGVGGSQEAESRTVTTSAPLPTPINAAYVVANDRYGRKLKRKKADRAQLAAASELVPSKLKPPHNSKREKQNDPSNSNEFDRTDIPDEAKIAPPQDFAGDESKGAFWTETVPRYSPTLGVSLPEFMLSRTEHEASFDETVAGA